ncbi:hypothetical protein, partial [Mesorhizobium sp. M7A.F.Ca.ET.027.03.2.1]|uniref:hypothetical protein n=1 Tax=Mesorhizobium sp. M7A.F.Ca.ET.027.03.2.1 TaxID=2496656 RepID=UPI001AED084D
MELLTNLSLRSMPLLTNAPATEWLRRNFSLAAMASAHAIYAPVSSFVAPVGFDSGDPLYVSA